MVEIRLEWKMFGCTHFAGINCTQTLIRFSSQDCVFCVICMVVREARIAKALTSYGDKCNTNSL